MTGTRRILHLSDLHFGRVNNDLIGPLLAKVAALEPDLVAISGDLTQRARSEQFHAARAFIDRIAAPCVVVPGNHDVPLDNLVVRFVKPFRNYRRIIDRNLEPAWSDEVINVIGVNTVNPFAWQSGRIRSRTVRRVCAAFDQRRHRRMRVVVLHHPLDHPPGVDKRLMRGARAAVGQMAECGADIVLCGHLHSWRAEPITAREGGRATLLVQAGTGLSTRLRGELNDFNLITLGDGAVEIERHVSEDGRDFAPAGRSRFVRDGEDWQEVAAAEGAAPAAADLSPGTQAG